MYICEICGFNISNFADIVDCRLLHKFSEKITFLVVAEFCFRKIHVYMEYMADIRAVFASPDFDFGLDSFFFQYIVD